MEPMVQALILVPREYYEVGGEKTRALFRTLTLPALTGCAASSPSSLSLCFLVNAAMTPGHGECLAPRGAVMRIKGDHVQECVV